MLSSRERFFISVLFVSSAAAASLHLVLSSRRYAADLGRAHHTVSFSTGFFTHPSVHPELAQDGNPGTAWIDWIPKGQANRKEAAAERAGVATGSKPSSLPDPERLYIQMRMGLTHFPGHPPLLNLPEKLLLWSGDQSDARHFQDYSRPRRIRLIFFKQELVDIDREVRFPDPPDFWAEKDLTLEDRTGVQSVNLDFLPPVAEARAFPKGIYQIWLRIEIETVYPGRLHPDQVALSEVDYAERLPSHIGVATKHE